MPKWHVAKCNTRKYGENSVARPGTFKPGNPGKPPGKGKAALLLEALEKAAKAKDTTFFAHVAEQALTDNHVLTAVLKKVVPDLKSIEIDPDAVSQIKFVLVKETRK